MPLRCLLLENIHPRARVKLETAGILVETVPTALPEEQLIHKLDSFDLLGIRSGTQVSENVLRESNHLLAIGCFCIGTNQVDLKTAEIQGMPVFNSPYANSRSVAELIIGQIVALSRQLGDRNREMHAGQWNKLSKSCHEIRGKTLGIIGYGHIGTQLSVLAESLGMTVIYYDIVKKLGLGNASFMPTLEALLARADFVTLHVPLSKETENMITSSEVKKMKYGSYLLNASRGNVVNIPDVLPFLESGHLAGAYFDVYPDEPGTNGLIPEHSVIKLLQNRKNVLLTPHIGGSTEEAQEAIADEVTDRLLAYLHTGDTLGAVNFPQVSPGPKSPTCWRILNVHLNIPGVLRDLNKSVDQYNIINEHLSTTTDIGYAVMDLDVNTQPVSLDQLHRSITSLSSNIKSRILPATR
jgi:D-3-phosphoglycerate dehydrogenase